MTRCEPHKNLLLDPSEPFPVGVNTDYCHTCWKAAGGVSRSRVTARKTTTCRRLSLQTVQLPGSPRVWRKCEGGYGSTTRDERAGHCCGCASPAPGVWRIGHECGTACPGYSTS